MKNTPLFLILAMAGVLFFSAYAGADCSSDCIKGCAGKKGKAYSDCMTSCLQDCVKYDPPAVPDVPAPTPVKPTKPEKK